MHLPHCRLIQILGFTPPRCFGLWCSGQHCTEFRPLKQEIWKYHKYPRFSVTCHVNTARQHPAKHWNPMPRCWSVSRQSSNLHCHTCRRILRPERGIGLQPSAINTRIRSDVSMATRGSLQSQWKPVANCCLSFCLHAEWLNHAESSSNSRAWTLPASFMSLKSREMFTRETLHLWHQSTSPETAASEGYFFCFLYPFIMFFYRFRKEGRKEGKKEGRQQEQQQQHHHQQQHHQDEVPQQTQTAAAPPTTTTRTRTRTTTTTSSTRSATTDTNTTTNTKRHNISITAPTTLATNIASPAFIIFIHTANYASPALINIAFVSCLSIVPAPSDQTWQHACNSFDLAILFFIQPVFFLIVLHLRAFLTHAWPYNIFHHLWCWIYQLIMSCLWSYWRSICFCIFFWSWLLVASWLLWLLRSWLLVAPGGSWWLLVASVASMAPMVLWLIYHLSINLSVKHVHQVHVVH